VPPAGLLEDDATSDDDDELGHASAAPESDSALAARGDAPVPPVGVLDGSDSDCSGTDEPPIVNTLLVVVDDPLYSLASPSSAAAAAEDAAESDCSGADEPPMVNTLRVVGDPLYSLASPSSAAADNADDAEKPLSPAALIAELAAHSDDDYGDYEEEEEEEEEEDDEDSSYVGLLDVTGAALPDDATPMRRTLHDSMLSNTEMVLVIEDGRYVFASQPRDDAEDDDDDEGDAVFDGGSNTAEVPPQTVRRAAASAASAGAVTSAEHAFVVGTSGPAVTVCLVRSNDSSSDVSNSDSSTTGGSFGLRIVGGAEDLAGASFVSEIVPGGSAALGGLAVGDRLLAVDGACTLALAHGEVAALLAAAPAAAAIVVQRLDSRQSVEEVLVLLLWGVLFCLFLVFWV
jgi:hypothetical protein